MKFLATLSGISLEIFSKTCSPFSVNFSFFKINHWQHFTKQALLYLAAIVLYTLFE